jgi:hypothetical protein
LKYWANNDPVKLSDTEGLDPPLDAFKTEKREHRTRKWDVHEKVTNIDHWPKTDRIGDPLIQHKWDGGNQKWSDVEKKFKCDGNDRKFRTF